MEEREERPTSGERLGRPHCTPDSLILTMRKEEEEEEGRKESGVERKGNAEEKNSMREMVVAEERQWKSWEVEKKLAEAVV